jgi:putative phage-type endonuclease
MDKKINNRKFGIGGSDIPIIMGLSNYKTPYQLYLEKIDDSYQKYQENELQEWGNILEPIIRIKFAEKNNLRIFAPKIHAKYQKLSDLISYESESIVHPLYEYMRGNLDGFIPELNSVLEIKCSNQFMSNKWGNEGSDSIPINYLLQVAYYCMLTNADNAYIAVLIGGNSYKEFIYKRDIPIESKIIKEAKKFWECVKNRTPPQPINDIDLRIMFPGSKHKKSLIADDIITNQLNIFNATREKIKLLTDEENKSKFNIMEYMKDSELLLDDQGNKIASWKKNKKGSRTLLIKNRY